MVILEALIGLAIGILYKRIFETLRVERFVKLIVISSTIAILYLCGMLTVVLMLCFALGLFIYEEYLEDRW